MKTAFEKRVRYLFYTLNPRECPSHPNDINATFRDVFWLVTSPAG